MVFPDGVHSRDDAIIVLELFAGRQAGGLGDYDFDDFAHEKSDDPKVEVCRLRVRDELLPILLSKDEDRMSRVSALVNELVSELRHDD